MLRAAVDLHVYARKDGEWILKILLDFEKFTFRPPSPLESQVILEALNEEKKAQLSSSLCVCVPLCPRVLASFCMNVCMCVCVCVSECMTER